MSTDSQLNQLNESLLRIERQGNTLFQSCKLSASKTLFICTESEIGGVQLRDYLHGIEAFLCLIRNAGFCVRRTEIKLTDNRFRLFVAFECENED